MKLDPNVIGTFIVRYIGIGACVYLGWSVVGPWIDRIIPG